MGINIIILAVQIALSMSVLARPISYSGGSTLMARSNELANTVFFHYSPSYKYSVGLQAFQDKVINQDYTNVRFTYLLNRKNTRISQRNLYFLSGFSVDQPKVFDYGLMADWETRRWFAGAGVKQTHTENKDYSAQYIQLGLAPYIGDYGDLHTWLLLTTEKDSITSKWQTYPALKVFYGNALLELGLVDDEDVNVHFIYRF